ncbi:MAG: Vitamin B12 import ATP-binding protein BtuD [Rhodocyclaceae bacterium]|nr:MAG: ABC transporter ATP-binding protein [Rhodocyclaceae bacterium]MBV6406581.1 Vitamin B12 import ATP-binding protein BtuD [Rhodocyclaceae bacterium]
MSTSGLQVSLRQRAPIPLAAELDCAPGELLALVGPSGSGKSTILRCIAGLHAAAEGAIHCNGEAWFDAAGRIDRPVQARRIGFVFQNYGLFPHLSALENVAAALGGLTFAERTARARELLARVHLDGLEQRKPAALSGGQQQRVAVARALARDPAVLLLDEPFSAVDQVTRRKLQQELARLRAELDIPMLLVTHDLDEARMLADRMVILHRGKTLQAGTPDEVMTRPASAAIARLVGLHNLFEGTLVEDGGALRLAWLGHRIEVARVDGRAGERMNWVIPSEGVLLHRQDRPSRGEAENPVSGFVQDCLRLGPFTQLRLVPEGCAEPIAFSVPTHVVARNGIAPGVRARVTLRAESIHLMPWEAPSCGD